MKRTVVLVVVATGLTLGGVAVWVGALAASETEKVRYDRESRYYRVLVVDDLDEGKRCLYFSKLRGVQSRMILADPIQLDVEYSRTMMAALALHPAPKDVLLVGLGGASIPRFMNKHWPDIRLDVVEIDADVVKVCQQWFELKGAPGLRIIVMDGRMYLKRSRKAYDVILLDAYAADRIPFHLTTMEFVQLARSRLKAGGVMVSNLWEYSVNRFYDAELKTFQAAFPQTYLFKAGTSGNILLFGTLEPSPTPKAAWVARAKTLVGNRDLKFDLPGLIADQYEMLTDRTIGEKPLTDDMAPVDTLRHEHPKHFETATSGE